MRFTLERMEVVNERAGRLQHTNGLVDLFLLLVVF